MLPHRRYNSRVINFALRQADQWRDRTQKAMQRFKLGLEWTAQFTWISLSGLFRAVGLASQVLGSATQQGLKLLQWAVDPDEYEASISGSSTPVLRVLDVICLNVVNLDVVNLDGMVPEQGHYTAHVSALPVRRDSWLQRFGHAVRKWVADRQGPGNALGLSQQNSSLLPMVIRGVASQLETRSLCLVTTENQILDVLTPAQQAIIRSRISWELARYFRGQRRARVGSRVLKLATLKLATLKLENLKLENLKLASPKRMFEKSHQLLHLPPCPPFLNAKGYILGGSEVQSPPKLGDLGGECNRFGTFQTSSKLASVNVLPLRKVLDDASPQAPRVSSNSPLVRVGTIVAQIKAFAHHSVAGVVRFSQTLSRPKLRVQGIASLLENRHLVLITPENNVLDVLSAAQQRLMYQRIEARLKDAGLTRSWPQNWRQGVISQSKALGQWLFRSMVGAIAALPFVVIPALASPTQPLPPSTPSADLPMEPLWADPTQLAALSKVQVIPAVRSPLNGGKRWTEEKTGQTESLTALTVPVASPRPVQPRVRYTAQGPEVRVEAEFIGYEPHLLERILGGLDVVMTWLESGIAIAMTLLGIITLAAVSLFGAIAQRGMALLRFR